MWGREGQGRGRGGDKDVRTVIRGEVLARVALAAIHLEILQPG